MKQAILVVYAEEQDCPSRPHEQLVDIPEDKASRDEVLRAWFLDIAIACDPADVDITIIDTPDGEYGDIQVHNGEGVHMFVTFVQPSCHNQKNHI